MLHRLILRIPRTITTAATFPRVSPRCPRTAAYTFISVEASIWRDVVMWPYTLCVRLMLFRAKS